MESVRHLRHAVDLESYSLGTNTNGQPAKTYSKYARVWANINPVASNETTQANGSVTVDQADILIRYNSTITTKDRIKDDNGNYWEITSIINEDMRNKYLKIRAILKRRTNG